MGETRESSGGIVVCSSTIQVCLAAYIKILLTSEKNLVP